MKHCRRPCGRDAKGQKQQRDDCPALTGQRAKQCGQFPPENSNPCVHLGAPTGTPAQPLLHPPSPPTTPCSLRWRYCNYGDADVGFPRDCGYNGYSPNHWFTMPGGLQSPLGVTDGLAFDVFGPPEACPVACQDVAGWADADGSTCATYEREGWCHQSWVAHYAVDGLSARDACCACQTGARPSAGWIMVPGRGPSYWSCRTEVQEPGLAAAKEACARDAGCFAVAEAGSGLTLRSGTYTAGMFYGMSSACAQCAVMDPGFAQWRFHYRDRSHVDPTPANRIVEVAPDGTCRQYTHDNQDQCWTAHTADTGTYNEGGMPPPPPLAQCVVYFPHLLQ